MNKGTKKFSRFQNSDKISIFYQEVIRLKLGKKVSISQAVRNKEFQLQEHSILMPIFI